MPLNQMQDFTFKHSDQQDAIYTQYTAQQIKALFDSRGDELRTALNILITALTSTEGASDIGTNTIQDIDGTTVQAMLQSIRDKLKSVADGTSGADYVNATAITGLTGLTVQSILESLKTYVDSANTTSTNNLADHKTSGDHDTRYFTKTELQSVVSGSSGADKVKASPIAVGSGDTVQAQLAWLLSQIAVAATGSIPDGSLTESKLAQAIVDKINTALSNTGVLTTLTTTDKSSSVNAINEVNGALATHKTDLASQTTGKGASLIGINDSANQFMATNVEGALSELFTSVSNGKSTVANAITQKGQTTSGSDTFEQLATAISNINTGKKWATGLTTSLSQVLTVNGLSFKPSTIILNYGTTWGNWMYNFAYVDTRLTNNGNGVYIRILSGGFTDYSSTFASYVTITNTGFSVSNLGTNNSQYTWIAFE